MSDFIEFGVPVYYDEKISGLNPLDKVKINILFSKFILKKNEIACINRIKNGYAATNNKIENTIYIDTVHKRTGIPDYIECASEEEADDVFDRLSAILAFDNVVPNNDIDCGSGTVYVSPSVTKIKHILFCNMDAESKFNLLKDKEGAVFDRISQTLVENKSLVDLENIIYNDIHISNEDKLKDEISCSYDSWKYKIRLILSRINEEEFVYKSEWELL